MSLGNIGCILIRSHDIAFELAVRSLGYEFSLVGFYYMSLEGLQITVRNSHNNESPPFMRGVSSLHTAMISGIFAETIFYPIITREEAELRRAILVEYTGSQILSGHDILTKILAVTSIIAERPRIPSALTASLTSSSYILSPLKSLCDIPSAIPVDRKAIEVLSSAFTEEYSKSQEYRTSVMKKIDAANAFSAISERFDAISSIVMTLIKDINKLKEEKEPVINLDSIGKSLSAVAKHLSIPDGDIMISPSDDRSRKVEIKDGERHGIISFTPSHILPKKKIPLIGADLSTLSTAELNELLLFFDSADNDPRFFELQKRVVIELSLR